MFYGLGKKAAKTTPKWQKTSVHNLVRHASGRYYARAYSGGKELWKSLKTSHFSVAKARLAEFMDEHRKSQPGGPTEGSIKMTFGQALDARLQNLADNPALKPATRHYWNQIFTSLLKSWPELAERQVRRITATECREWMRKFRKGASATRFNNTISALRHVFEIAIEKGVIHSNPAAKLERLPIRSKPPTLPSRSQFLALIQTVETAGAWCSRDCADFLRGLAFTGCRKGEAAQIQWGDVDFKSGEVVIRGDAQTGTKNWTIRRAPPDSRSPRAL